MLDRREFLQALAAWVAADGRRGPRALVTADTEAHVVVVDLARRRVAKRIRTREGPRSIEATGRGRALVGHADAGVVTVIEDGRVRRVLRGFGQPRYTAVHGNRAYVSDGGTGEIAVIDLARARVIRRVAVGDGARHITIDPRGETLWCALGSSAARIALIDLDGWTTRYVTPPFLAHDVGFSPSGRRVWVTAGREPRIAIYGRGGALRRVLGADRAPQHVSFGSARAYVASGEGPSLRVHALDDARVLRSTRVPYGSYNVQRAGGRVLTPSLGTGALTILDARGRITAQIRVARNAHDACIALPVRSSTGGGGGASLPAMNLKLALTLDAVITGVSGIAYLALAEPLHDLLGTQASTLRLLGAFLVVFAVGVAVVSRSLQRPAVVAVIAANVLWVVDSLLVVAAGWLDLETAGAVWAVMQAATVAGFAALQWSGLRARAL
ncbi:MAG TPA: hypothetical protein VFZ89_17670 [Solirubrobacteraceae bacterium]